MKSIDNVKEKFKKILTSLKLHFKHFASNFFWFTQLFLSWTYKVREKFKKILTSLKLHFKHFALKFFDLHNYFLVKTRGYLKYLHFSLISLRRKIILKIYHRIRRFRFYRNKFSYHFQIKFISPLNKKLRRVFGKVEFISEEVYHFGIGEYLKKIRHSFRRWCIKVSRNTYRVLKEKKAISISNYNREIHIWDLFRDRVDIYRHTLRSNTFTVSKKERYLFNKHQQYARWLYEKRKKIQFWKDDIEEPDWFILPEKMTKMDIKSNREVEFVKEVYLCIASVTLFLVFLWFKAWYFVNWSMLDYYYLSILDAVVQFVIEAKDIFFWISEFFRTPFFYFYVYFGEHKDWFEEIEYIKENGRDIAQYNVEKYIIGGLISLNEYAVLKYFFEYYYWDVSFKKAVVEVFNAYVRFLRAGLPPLEYIELIIKFIWPWVVQGIKIILTIVLWVICTLWWLVERHFWYNLVEIYINLGIGYYIDYTILLLYKINNKIVYNYPLLKSIEDFIKWQWGMFFCMLKAIKILIPTFVYYFIVWLRELYLGIFYWPWVFLGVFAGDTQGLVTYWIESINTVIAVCAYWIMINFETYRVEYFIGNMILDILRYVCYMVRYLFLSYQELLIFLHGNMGGTLSMVDFNHIRTIKTENWVNSPDAWLTWTRRRKRLKYRHQLLYVPKLGPKRKGWLSKWIPDGTLYWDFGPQIWARHQRHLARERRKRIYYNNKIKTHAFWRFYEVTRDHIEVIKWNDEIDAFAHRRKLIYEGHMKDLVLNAKGKFAKLPGDLIAVLEYWVGLLLLTFFSNYIYKVMTIEPKDRNTEVSEVLALNATNHYYWNRGVPLVLQENLDEWEWVDPEDEESMHFIEEPIKLTDQQKEERLQRRSRNRHRLNIMEQLLNELEGGEQAQPNYEHIIDMIEKEVGMNESKPGISKKEVNRLMIASLYNAQAYIDIYMKRDCKVMNVDKLKLKRASEQFWASVEDIRSDLEEKEEKRDPYWVVTDAKGWVEIFIYLVYVIVVASHERALVEDWDKFIYFWEEFPFLIEDLLRNRIGYPVGTWIADYCNLEPGRDLKGGTELDITISAYHLGNKIIAKVTDPNLMKKEPTDKEKYIKELLEEMTIEW